MNKNGSVGGAAYWIIGVGARLFEITTRVYIWGIIFIDHVMYVLNAKYQTVIYG